MKIKKITAALSAAAVMASMLTPVTVSHAQATTLEVGKDKAYTSIAAAVSAAQALNPQSEADMVTINIDPGDYEEQVVFDNAKYITLQQTPGTEGQVDLHWYYCTGYCAANADLDGYYDPDLDWSADATWTGPDGKENLTRYEVGQKIAIGTEITYYTKSGVKKSGTVKANFDCLGWTGGMDKMATLIVRNNSENITVKDLNIVNSLPVFVTQGEKDAHVTPSSDYPNLPDRSKLSVCDEDTPEVKPTADIFDSKGAVNLAKYTAYDGTFTDGESAWLAHSSIFNERGHAVSVYSGDKITFDGIRLRGGQDSLYCNGGRVYFNNCDLIGGTDYIYGGASAVFNNCKLGFEGFSDEVYGSPLTTPNTKAERKYGYLFFNCTIYNVRENAGTSNFGGPWGSAGQATFYNTTLDDNGTVGASALVIDPLGWRRFNAENGLGRLYEYGTKNASGTAVDLSKRIVNKSVEEGGYGMGTVVDDWQILEFNPRNYFAADCGDWSDDWDPMNFAEKLEAVDAALDSTSVTVPSNESTEISLPSAPSGVTFKWESDSSNAVVSDDGTKLTVVRPAAGEESIETTVTLYAKDNENGYGDKKEVPVTITATTDTTNVFNIPVTITESVALSEAADYDVTISKNGAVIKKQTVTVPAGQTTASATIENVPATASGIDYDISIVSSSDEMTITVPEDGKKTVKGITGQDVPLDITVQKQIDHEVDVNINYSSTDGVKKYDLIALAKENGAADSITSSDYITVSYKLDVAKSTSGNGYIDILSTAPADTCSTSGVTSRFLLGKLGHWNQLDYVDCAQGYSGSSNGPDQWLNACGKFDTTTISETSVSIDYKNLSLSAWGKGTNAESSYTFETFPTTYEKGKLYMAIYPGSENFSISDVTVTYKRVVKEGEVIPTAAPKATATPKPTTDPEVAGYGTMVSNDDGSKTLYFGQSSITQSNSQAKIISDTVNGISLLRPDYFYPGTNGYGELTMHTVNLKDSGYDKVDFVLANRDTSDVVIKVGGTKVAEKSGVTTGGWTPYQTFTADLTTTDAEGNVTIESTVTSGSFCGNFAYLRFYNSTPQTATPSPEVTTEPTEAPTSEPTVSTEAPTTAPTEAPTSAPTNAPAVSTEAPSTAAAIKDVKVENGNTIVTLENISNGVVIAVERNGNAVSKIKTKDITENPVTVEGIEADEVYVWDSLQGMKPLCNSYDVKASSETPSGTPSETPSEAPTEVPTAAPTAAATEEPTLSPTAPASTVKPITDTVVIDFTTMSEVPVYTLESGQGFVEYSDSIMPSGYARQVAPTNNITLSSNGASVTESDGSYLHTKTNSDDGDDYNYGGLIYRIDTGAAGAYHIEVEITGTSSDTRVAPTGMDASRLTGTSNWDNAGEVPRSVSAKWSDSTWSYDFGTGENFVEIEIEPSSLATASAPKTVGVKKITVTPLDVNAKGDKPTIHILGDSTQKTYTFNETISSWGQTLGNYFDKNKVNVINYSMGGRAMKSNYAEGRFDEILINGKAGDFVFIHSAHNDETISNNRFSRGSGSVKDDLSANNESYNKWLNMYVEAIKARGMTPILVTAMPRINSATGKYSESDTKPNGFNPDSPGNMRTKATADEKVGLVELYDGAKEYINSLDPKEVSYIYNSIESGETPAANSANGANGDGTHYREAAAKQWCRIMLQSIYDQSAATGVDTYTDKTIMQELTTYMNSSVISAAKSGDWSAVFPEMASDVSAVGVVPNATKQTSDNFYYRTSIEKSLQLGLLHKDSNNLFKPTQNITVGEFARGVEKAFGLEENALTSYTKTADELASASTSSVEEMSIEDSEDSDNEIALLSDDNTQYTVTVTQPTGGTVTIYNESAYHTATADIPASVTASAVINDNDYFTLTAPSEIVTKKDSNGVFANKEITTNAIEVRNNGTKQPKYVAKASGTLTLYLMFVDHKLITCENKTTGTKVTKYINDTDVVGTTQANQYNAVTFNVEKGNTYEVYTNGGTGRLFGVMYASTDYPQSTEALTVNSGDKVRVVAAPSENYINNAIIVNGGEAAKTKEYTFTVTGDTTVTASFTAEPELVPTTVVASDAALTREVMGAILYDAYQLADKTNISKYMAQNGGVPSPSDPNYDPNIKYEGTPYIPLTGWGILTDKNQLSEDLYAKVKAAYNLGLIRSETGIARGSIANGTELEPKTEVTRAKAAKALVFAFTLTQPTSSASQLLPDGINHASETAEIIAPNENAFSLVVK